MSVEKDQLVGIENLVMNTGILYCALCSVSQEASAEYIDSNVSGEHSAVASGNKITSHPFSLWVLSELYNVTLHDIMQIKLACYNDNNLMHYVNIILICLIHSSLL
jgi:hypothetical protein